MSETIRNSSRKSVESFETDSSPYVEKKQHKKRFYYVLVKNFPKSSSLDDLTKMFQPFSSFQKVFRVEKTGAVYGQFSQKQEIDTLMKQNKILSNLDKNKLNLKYIKKPPLDLNKQSKIVLITLYQERIPVNVDNLYSCFSFFEKILKIIIFKKKNFQVLMEFDTVNQAAKFRKHFNKKNFKGFFYMKVQFTQKKNLIVRNNSEFERDFKNYVTNPLSPS